MTTAPQLNAAHRQWCDRPQDERFWDLSDLDAHVRGIRERSQETGTGLDALRIAPTDSGDLMLTRGAGRLAFTNWSFGQLCRKVAAPASYLTSLPATLAASCLNQSIQTAAKEAGADGGVSLLHYQNGCARIRAITSPRYERIWNGDITPRLLRLAAEDGWRNPPSRTKGEAGESSRPATKADCMGASFIREGDMISPGGLYASDRDMFAFLVDTSHTINDGSEDGLHRGFFVQNSEVGDCSFVLTFFLFRGTCGNHIIHGGKLLREIRIKHIGAANDRAFRAIRGELADYANASAAETEAGIVAAKSCILGTDKETVLDRLFGLKIASRQVLGAAWDGAYIDEDGSPDTAWGFAQAMTRYSQTIHWADKRTDLDRQAGKVLALAC
jgi:hypothetical protein